MSVGAVGHGAVQVCFSRWKLWLMALGETCFAAFIYAAAQDGFAFMAGLTGFIWFQTLWLSSVRRCAIVLDERGVFLKAFWYNGFLWGRRSIRWEEIGEVRTGLLWACSGIVIIPKGNPDEGKLRGLLRWAGIWPRPLMFDTAMMDVGASDLVGMIEDMRWRALELTTLDLNVRLR